MPKQKKRRKHKKQPKVLKLSPEKVAEILGKLEAAKVDDDVTEVFKMLIHENEWFFDQLEKGF